jgi:hypothetical protein
MTDEPATRHHEPHAALHALDGIAVYSPDLDASIRAYAQIGMTLQRHVAAAGPDESTAGALLRFPAGGATLLLHTDRNRQFTHGVISVDDLERTYRSLQSDESLLWLELPHATPLGSMALLRTADGNVFALLETRTNHSDGASLPAGVQPVA